jgi:hypothetical protein
MLCVLPCLAPVQTIAQSYVVNLFIKLFSISAESVQMIFVDKNNYIFVPNFRMLSFYAKIHLW